MVNDREGFVHYRRERMNVMYHSIDAKYDWERFISIFNRCTVFAPYTISLTKELAEKFIIPLYTGDESIALVGSDDHNSGIIHAGIYNLKENVKVGHIYMLFAESNYVAYRLLMEVEEWFKERNIKRIYAYWWFTNPYNFILHGRETYAWAGAFPTINAFRRLDYDILNDIIVMQLQMDEEPSIFVPNISGLEVRQKPIEDNELAWSGRVEAYIEDKKIGHCEFFYLKAISQHIKRNLGQITINVDSAFHGTGVARMLITHAHQNLYNKGTRNVMLATGQALFRAIKFYQKLGYKPELIKGYSYIKEDVF